MAGASGLLTEPRPVRTMVIVSFALPAAVRTPVLEAAETEAA
jgi:hypothetical protein